MGSMLARAFLVPSAALAFRPSGLDSHLLTQIENALESATRVELVLGDLQSPAWPLGYADIVWWRWRESNSQFVLAKHMCSH